MVWIELLNHIADSIGAIEEAPTVVIGGKRPEMLGVKPDSNGAVVLIRGTETFKNRGLQYNKVVTFFLECWIRNDSPDMAEGYEQIAELEEKVDGVLQALKTASGMITETAQLMDISIKNRAGDLDGRRPLVGSQYTIEALIYEEERSI